MISHAYCKKLIWILVIVALHNRVDTKHGLKLIIMTLHFCFQFLLLFSAVLWSKGWTCRCRKWSTAQTQVVGVVGHLKAFITHRFGSVQQIVFQFCTLRKIQPQLSCIVCYCLLVVHWKQDLASMLAYVSCILKVTVVCGIRMGELLGVLTILAWGFNKFLLW